MNLTDLIQRAPVPRPWAEGDKIPWHDPGFSERMLLEHLSQTHDAASRRAAVIDTHIDWIHRVVLDGRPSRVLDLGCGPGLYTSRLAALGHHCTGIDFSPAAIAYARESDPASAYHLADVRSAEYGFGYDLVMLLYGELNVFHPSDARLILLHARRALAQGGRILLEAHTDAAVRAMGAAPRVWRSAAQGLFSPSPHLWLQESFWDDEERVATTRHFIVDAADASVTAHAETVQSYSPAGYRALLDDCGLHLSSYGGSLTGLQDDDDFVVLLAETADAPAR